MTVQLEKDDLEVANTLRVESRQHGSELSTGLNRSLVRVVHNLGTADGAGWGVDQLRHLKALGYEASAIVPASGSTGKSLAEQNIPYEVFSSDAGWQAHSYWKLFKQMYGLAFVLFRNRYHIVQHHILISFIHSRIAAWIADVPIRLYMVATPALIEGSASNLIERLTSWMDTGIIAGCEYSLLKYRQIGVNHDRMRLIYYGTDATKFNPSIVCRHQARLLLEKKFGIEQSAPVVGRVAYFYPPEPKTDFLPPYLWNHSIKDHELLIDSMPLVLREVPTAKFVFVGSGWGTNGAEYIESLRARAESLSVSDSLVFVGGRTDIPDMLSSFDVSVQCSRLDGLGGTAESLLMERPVIATRVGGFTDTVKQEQTGLLVDRSNHEQLAEAIVRLLKNPELATTLGKNGRKLMLESFCLDKSIDSLDALYQRSIIRASSVFGWRLNRLIGHRLPVMCTRAILALPIIALTGYLCARSDIHAQLGEHWRSAQRLITHHLWTKWRYLPWSEYVKIPFLALKQLTETIIASALIILTAPIWLCILLSSRISKHEVLSSNWYLGAGNKPFQAYTFNSGVPARFRRMPLFLNVVKQDMSIVGTRLRTSSLSSDENRDSSLPDERWRMKPGITGWCQLNMTRSHTEAELEGLDMLYMADWSFGLDLKILLKSILTSFKLR